MMEPVLNGSSSQTRGGGGLFRRAEDWERLTRLEFLVEEVIRDNERRDERIEAIVRVQEDISQTQRAVIGHLKNVKHLLIGALIGMSIAYFGLDKILGTLLGLSGIVG